MRERFCIYCHNRPIPKGNRKYCSVDSKKASALLKQQYREDWKARGERYWEDAWKNSSPEARREYFRLYMREYRKRKRTQTPLDCQRLETKGRR